MKRILAVFAMVMLLSGCFAPIVSDPATSDDPDFASGSTRTPALAVSCADLVPLSALRTIYGEDLEQVPYREAGAQGSWTMQGTALLQDGVLACGWSTSEDDRPDVLILALDAATEGFERSEPSFLESETFDYREIQVGDSAEAYCRNDAGDDGIRCHWDVLVGDVWLSFYFRDVDPAEVDDDLAAKPSGALGGIVNSALESVVSAERNAVDRVDPTVAGCNETLEPDAVAAILAVPVADLYGAAGRPLEQALGSSNPTFGQVMWAYSYERLGYTECVFGVEALNGSAIVAPGAAWILTEPGAIQTGITSIDDLGSGTRECLRDGDYALCSVAIAVGQDLALVQMVGLDEAAAERAALEIARLLVSS